MADMRLRSVIRQLRLLVGASGEANCRSDAKLLEAFVQNQDEAALEVLIWRHGTMVLNLCRRILHDEHQAEDAFQAVFMVFVQNAGSIDKGQSVSSWLFKVAYRVAHRQRAKVAKEPQRRANIDDRDEDQPADALIWRELRPVLDEEIDRLPEKYRAPIVLCYLQGHTTQEAADILHCPKGTVLSQLSRAREQLKSRLTRRGLAISAVWLATHLAANASSAAVSETLVSSTVTAAIAIVPATAAAAGAAGSAAAPAKGFLHALLLTKVNTAAAVFTVAALGLGGGTLAQWALTTDQVQQVSPIAMPAEAAGDDADAQSGGNRQVSNAKSYPPGPIRFE